VRSFALNGVTITDESPAYVLAELGNNHQGSAEIAHKMIDMAADCGAHGVKFQRRTNATLYSRALLDQPYDNENSFGATYGEHRAALELPLGVYPSFIQHAHDRGLACVCTAFDEQAADELVSVGIDGIKIASGGVTDTALLAHVAALNVPTIISTGGCAAWQIVEAQAICRRAALLHCTASYPCEFIELNLRTIGWFERTFPSTLIGWSGHDNGIAMAVVAYTLGARIIEKHITLNRAMKGTDHAFSLEPAGLKKLCRDLARAHVALGDGVKKYYDSERKPIAKMRRRLTTDGLKITGEVDK
jgi:N-acetylneuraminate synthase/sialic acid synthase